MTQMSVGWIFLALLYCCGVISVDGQQLDGSPPADCSKCGIGILPKDYRLIINGKPIEDTKWFPWMVSLKLFDGHKCGAAILSDRYILTAGHCVPEGTKRKYLKVHLQTESPKQMSKAYEIEKFVVHPKYGFVVAKKLKANFAKYDIALLKLKEKITCNAFINPICLPDPKVKMAVDQKNIIMGWGTADAKEKKELPIMHYASVKNLDFQECVKEIPEHEQVRDHMLCQGGTDQTACFGDSGGPMSQKVGDKFYIFGIASSVTDMNCPVTQKVLYTNVVAFVDWVKKEMQ